MRPLTKAGRYISNRIGKAIADYNLIEDGDRILVAVSGGKDSLTLLNLLNIRKTWAPIDYELIAMHVETDIHCGGCVHTKVLGALFKEMGVRHHFEKISLGVPREKVSCFWCSWNRRKALFLAAGRFKCNKIAFGHHKDDIVETMLLNLFYNGEFAAMNPRQELFKGKITLIRPLCYVEEDKVRHFAKESGFPSQLCRCPNAETSKRRLMKELIATVKRGCPYVKTNLMNSATRIKHEYLQIKGSGDAPEKSVAGARVPRADQDEKTRSTWQHRAKSISRSCVDPRPNCRRPLAQARGTKKAAI